MVSISWITVLLPILLLEVGFGYALTLSLVMLLSGVFGLLLSYLFYRLFPRQSGMISDSIILSLVHVQWMAVLEIVSPGIVGGLGIALPLSALVVLMLFQPRDRGPGWQNGFMSRIGVVVPALLKISGLSLLFGFLREVLALGTISFPGLAEESLTVIPEAVNPRLGVFLIPGSIFLLLGVGLALHRRFTARPTPADSEDRSENQEEK